MEIDQTYEVVRIDGDDDPLKEHPQNPRRGVVEVIDESIEHNGWYGAVTAQKATGYILAGNHRYRVAKERGAKEIPVIWKDVDDETALRILLVDNKSADMGQYDEEALSTILQNLESLDGTGYGTILHPLEEKLESDRSESAPPRGSADSDGSDDEELGLDEDEIPDDQYAPQFGIMLVVDSEQQQQGLYEMIKEFLDEAAVEGVKMRVVAV